MGTIDLDAARAARAETEDGAHDVVLGGQHFALPAELPFAVGNLWAENKTKEGLDMLLGDDAEAFWALRPSVADVTALVAGLAEEYGFGGGAGESSASNGSSPNTSSRSRPTSPVSTG